MGGREIPVDGLPAEDFGETGAGTGGGVAPLPSPGYERADVGYVPPGEGTPVQEADLKAYEEGYMAGVEYAEAEARRLRAKLAEAEAELSAIRRHPLSRPKSVCCNGEDVFKVLDAMADDMTMIRRDMGAAAAVLYWMKKRDDREGNEQ